MAIEINENNSWYGPGIDDGLGASSSSPLSVVTCMPGAEAGRTEVNDNTYLGKVKVKLGAITASLQG